MNGREKVSTLAFFAKQRVLRPGAYSRYQEFMRQQYFQRARLSQLEWAKRTRLLTHAYEFTHHYRNVLDAAGIHPGDLQHPRDWERIPILTREDLVRRGPELVSREAPRGSLLEKTTGGSTGKPVKVFHDRRFPSETLTWRMLDWWGVSPGADSAYSFRLGRESWTARTANALMWWPTRRIWLDASMLTPANVDRFLREFAATEPSLLQGYVGAISFVAAHILERRISVPSPEAVWVTAAPVLDPDRRMIEEAFRAPVYDQYGCSEIFSIAAQCSLRQSLHVFSDSRSVEVVDEEGEVVPPGTYGRLVITDLENFAFPLIRYANGDRGRLIEGECECGVKLPLMEQVLGRVSDQIKLRGGSVVAGEFLTTIFDNHTEDVRAFQVIQQRDHSLLIRVVPDAQSTRIDEVLQAVTTQLRRRVGPDLPIRFEHVSEIPSDRGKTRFIISEVGR